MNEINALRLCRPKIRPQRNVKRPGVLPGLEILWWALRDSNPEPRDYESPALTVAPRALMYCDYNFSNGNSFPIGLNHDLKYYHAQASRTTHDQAMFLTPGIP